MNMQPKSLIPKILEPIQLHLIGIVYYGNPFHKSPEYTYENEIGKMWNRFFSLFEKYKSYFENISNEQFTSYEIHIETDEFRKTKQYNVFVGISIDSLEETPLELFSKTLPKTQYLKIDVKNKEVKKAEKFIWSWFHNEQADFIQSFPYLVQKYDSRYKGLNNPESIYEWWIPIRKKEEDFND